MHVVPILLTCLIVCSLGIVGYGIVDGLGRQYPSTRRWLLMPFAGLALYAVAATFLNRAGLPAKSFAVPLLIGLLVANLSYGVIRRPNVSWRMAAPWCGAIVAAMLLVGWPLVVAGTNWISTGNGDMTNYVLGANHFYEHGFYQLPSPNELNREVDRSWNTSFYYSLGEVRSASQLILACLMALTGLSAVQNYMILTVAFHVVAIMTAAALICKQQSRTGLSLAVFIAIALSANFAYGTFIQLLPQDFGLAALSASALVLLEMPPKGVALYTRACLGGLFIATLLLAYPELLPFLALAILIFAAIALYRRELQWRRVVPYLVLICILAILFTNTSLLGISHELIEAQGADAGNKIVNALFPSYLMPLGFAIGWGFLPYGTPDVSSVQAQAYTLVGIALYVIALVIACKLTWRLEAAGIMAATMLLLFFYLFATQNGFGLFKLAMYAQPFVLASLAIAISTTLPSVSKPAQAKVPV